MRTRQTQPGRRIGGYTLVELLVVMVIIGVLAVLIFTGTNAAMTKARQTKSMGNLKQLGSGTMLYLNENNGRVFYARSRINGRTVWWPDRDVLGAYLNGADLYMRPGSSPADNESAVADFQKVMIGTKDNCADSAEQPINWSYWICAGTPGAGRPFTDTGYLNPDGSAVLGSTISRWDDPANTILFAEGFLWNGMDRIYRWGDGKSCVLWADFSVRRVSYSTIRPQHATMAREEGTLSAE